MRKGTVLEGSDLFDAEFFGLSVREAQILDPQQRIFLECAWEAMEHAGYGAGISQNAVGVYAGTSLNTYLLTRILRNPIVGEAAGAYQVMLGNDKDFLCTRVLIQARSSRPEYDDPDCLFDITGRGRGSM